jgi:hypothetical protein
MGRTHRLAQLWCCCSRSTPGAGLVHAQTHRRRASDSGAGGRAGRAHRRPRRAAPATHAGLGLGPGPSGPSLSLGRSRRCSLFVSASGSGSANGCGGPRNGYGSAHAPAAAPAPGSASGSGAGRRTRRHPAAARSGAPSPTMGRPGARTSSRCFGIRARAAKAAAARPPRTTGHGPQHRVQRARSRATHETAFGTAVARRRHRGALRRAGGRGGSEAHVSVWLATYESMPQQWLVEPN